MQSSTCDVCGQPAVFHETAVQYRAPVVRHLCRVHGLPVCRSGIDLEAARVQRSLARSSGQPQVLHDFMAAMLRQSAHSGD